MASSSRPVAAAALWTTLICSVLGGEGQAQDPPGETPEPPPAEAPPPSEKPRFSVPLWTVPDLRDQLNIVPLPGDPSSPGDQLRMSVAPGVICTMRIIPLDPAVDPKIRMPGKGTATDYRIRIVPQTCAPQPTGDPAP